MGLDLRRISMPALCMKGATNARPKLPCKKLFANKAGSEVLIYDLEVLADPDRCGLQLCEFLLPAETLRSVINIKTVGVLAMQRIFGFQ